MADSIIRKRLKSLRDRQAEAQAKTAEAKLRKADRDALLVSDLGEAAEKGVTVWMLRRMREEPIVLPMAAYYQREDGFEARRARFYAHVALIYGSQGWMFQDPSMHVAAEAGYGGLGVKVRPIDKGSSVNINIMSAPLEWLMAKRLMETKMDADGAGMVRYAAALRYREDLEGSGAGLQAQAYEGASGGGQPGRPPSDYRIDCIRSVGELRCMPEKYYKLLESVVGNDEWAWKVKLRSHLPINRKARKESVVLLRKRAKKIILDLHRAMDITAKFYGLMSDTAYERRWRKFRRRT